MGLEADLGKAVLLSHAGGPVSSSQLDDLPFRRHDTRKPCL